MITLGCIAMLVGAYSFQFLGGLQPCTMCYWQRIPHAVVIGFGIFSGHFFTGMRMPVSILRSLCGLVMAVSAGLGSGMPGSNGEF